MYLQILCQISCLNGINRYIVAAEIGFRFKEKQYKDVNDAIDSYSKGHLSKSQLRGMIPRSKEHLETYERNGVEYRNVYLYRQNAERDKEIKRLKKNQPPEEISRELPGSDVDPGSS